MRKTEQAVVMQVIVAGGSGFIGRHLIPVLLAHGHTVTVLTRAQMPSQRTSEGLLRYVHWNPGAPEHGAGRATASVLSGADAIINLAGANIGSRRWTHARKAHLLNSRVCATETLIRAIRLIEEGCRPRILVNASGIDFYGDRGDEVLTEESTPGASFLARVCERWEQAALEAQPLGVRVVLMRTSVVLAKDALTLHLLAWPFRLFLGGPLGDGQQWFPWIHIDDIVGLYIWALSTAEVAGPVNAVAPDVRTQADTAHALGAVLSRPNLLRTPGGFLRLAMGEQADLLLHGHRAAPTVALAHSYPFRFPKLESALRACLKLKSSQGTTHDGTYSPFFPVLARVRDDLPEVLRDQYLVRPTDPYRVVFEGSMDQIWHRPFWLWPVLRVCACFDILFPEQGKDIGASMMVEGQYDERGGGAQTWNRTFQFRHPRHFNATMRFDLRQARVVEHMAPLGLLEVVWNVRYEKPSTIHIETEGIRVGMGRFRVTLPRWASVDVRVRETALVNRSETIAVDLRVQQPWLGEIFGYTGQFRVHREQKEERGA
ncbi:hypothetical protein KSF_027250 [Reticulibacter mediterranei]|uniref:TIGR01777 family protein n=1 Tax=Reticulibacter mediterranei TaxID=2778369 RepID=A0A8J3N089_9CHLR|nr:TIGR01777 family oxidoreductase [Reticulibacter mediterranei]GHO92677.1 hypothetical protein KSF_027250 [Reticulibacter mediterranei]